MLERLVMALPIATCLAGTAAAADFDPKAAHAGFIDAFNNRDWVAVKAQLADDAVFHRANAGEVQSGPDAIVAHFEQPIGGEWNVKFTRLDSEEQFAGNDGRVVERGDFAITAGADDSACYAGSYLATWARTATPGASRCSPGRTSRPTSRTASSRAAGPHDGGRLAVL
jgi:ketosteroid isomerase-like protein